MLGWDVGCHDLYLSKGANFELVGFKNADLDFVFDIAALRWCSHRQLLFTLDHRTCEELKICLPLLVMFHILKKKRKLLWMVIQGTRVSTERSKFLPFVVMIHQVFKVLSVIVVNMNKLPHLMVMV